MWFVFYFVKLDDFFDIDFFVENNIGWVVFVFFVFFGEWKINEDNDGSKLVCLKMNVGKILFFLYMF